MKKKILIAMMAAMIFTPNLAQAKAVPATRTMTGIYYDYMVIETKDGHEWLLSDKQAASNPYMKRKTVTYNGHSKKVYVPRFKSGQRVRVKFATMGTKAVTDDRIISVKVIK